MTFINVEPYQLEYNDGQLQPVLTGDPPQPHADCRLRPNGACRPSRGSSWSTRTGIVTASFMLIFSDDEIEAALKAVE